MNLNLKKDMLRLSRDQWMFLQQVPRIHLCLDFSRISNWFWQVRYIFRSLINVILNKRTKLRKMWWSGKHCIEQFWAQLTHPQPKIAAIKEVFIFLIFHFCNVNLPGWFFLQVQVLLRNEKGPGSLRPCQCFQKKELKLKTGQSRSWNRKQIRKEVQTENIAFGKKKNLFKF